MEKKLNKDIRIKQADNGYMVTDWTKYPEGVLVTTDKTEVLKIVEKYLE